MVVHIASLCLTGFFVYLSVPGTDTFSWHPACMAVAYCLLFLQAVLVFSPESSLIGRSTSRQEKVQLHWILHCFALCSAAFGFGSVYLNKEIHNRKHFSTWHAKIGLTAVVITIVATIFGLSANYSMNFRSLVKPLNLKMYHATLGMIAFVVAMVAVTFATYSNYFGNRIKTAWIARIVAGTPIILAVCVARQVTQSYLPRILEPKFSEIDAKKKKVEEKIKNKIQKKD